MSQFTSFLPLILFLPPKKSPLCACAEINCSVINVWPASPSAGGF